MPVLLKDMDVEVRRQLSPEDRDRVSFAQVGDSKITLFMIIIDTEYT